MPQHSLTVLLLGCCLLRPSAAFVPRSRVRKPPSNPQGTMPSEAAPKKEVKDLYDDPSIVDDEVLKPLTAEPNPHAPQEGTHLYYFRSSFYSWEARLFLEEKGIDFEHHVVCIIDGFYDQYDPDYVRINPRCVVPTLVVDGKVTSDSHNIIHYGDANIGGPDSPRLIPTDPEKKKVVDEYWDAASSIFVESLTFGVWEGGPEPPFLLKTAGKDHHLKKRKAIESLIEKHGDDPYLKAAYESKLGLMNKMLNTLGSEEDCNAVAAHTKEMFKKLNQQLEEGPAKDGKSWLCGEDYSIADSQWGLVIFRLYQRGADEYFFSQYPAVKAYYQRIYARPAFQSAIVRPNIKVLFMGYIMWRKLCKKIGWS